ncbi:MAG: cysteine--tRNA ligase [Candidatus Sungbacteria bacterium]|nr:cysteine--tRNA ligase [Candidatus Sungbacteria bacterium]
MKIRLYNTLTRRKEVFKPVRKNKVGLYTCGPTVYNYAHIGNLRTYIFEDVLRRTLEHAGYRVRHVMNMTDVEDKIIRDAKSAGKTIFEFTRSYERAFLDDLAKLGVQPAWKYPRATAHIPEMIELIKVLLKKGFAYEADGAVYFDISKFKSYGRLSRLKKRTLKAGARVISDEYAKTNAQDFALWKSAQPDEPSWSAPFGEGRPGWHIECSAMAMKYLGTTLDIHAGGVDLVFPHHENEIAQSEAATGKPFARFFAEGEHLLVDGKKMSKSLGNFLTLRDFEAKGLDPLAFRYLILTAHYRAKLNFTWKSQDAATQSFLRLREFVRMLDDAREGAKKGGKTVTLAPYEKRFSDTITDDLGTARALAVLWDLVGAYRKNPEHFDAKAVRRLINDFDGVLGLALSGITKEKIPAAIHKLARERDAARAGRDFARADRLRSAIRDAGYEIEDTPAGANLKKISS